MKRAKIGGQAVIEGVMMKSPTSMCIAVRTDKGIRIKKNKLKETSKLSRIPILRGIINFIDMMITGVTCLSLSTEMLDMLDEEPTKFEKWMSKVTGKSLEKIIIGFAVVLSIGLSILLFMLIPILVGEGMQTLTGIKTSLFRNLIEGLVRILIFIIYLVIVSKLDSIKRTFMYHGAEHKTIHCFEHEEPLTVENAKKYTTLHPRCGTAFLLIVMVVSILVFSVITSLLPDQANIWWSRTLIKLAFIPLVAGISYEILKFLAKSDKLIFRVLRYPGLQLQRLTTIEPTEDMLAVAIAAFEGVRQLDNEPPCSDCPPETYENDEKADTELPETIDQPDSQNEIVEEQANENSNG